MRISLLLTMFLVGWNTTFPQDSTIVWGNKIDTVHDNTWVVHKWNNGDIDSVFYDSNEKTGTIKTYSNKGVLRVIELYKNENLNPPEISPYTSFENQSDLEADEGYDGMELSFNDYYLVLRKIFYENGNLREVQRFTFGETEDTVITYDPLTMNETKTKSKRKGVVSDGLWEYYSADGKLIKQTLYKNNKVIEN